jgi:hypothetical protein
MRRLLTVLLLLGSLSAVFATDAVKGRLIKTLPLFLDLKGHDAISPSLFDRDAYQVYLRAHPEQCSAIRFDVLWQVKHPPDVKFKVRLELRGVGTNSLPQLATLEQDAKPAFFRRWTSLELGGADYKNFGEVVAWRATVWAGDQMIGEQKSFLW